MSDRIRGLRIILKWAARSLGLSLAAMVILIIVAHAFSEEGLPNVFAQPVGVQLEFIAFSAMLAGWITGWFRPGLAAVFIITGCIIFHAVEQQLFWNKLIWQMFDVSGILFLAAYLLERKTKREGFVKE